MATRQKRRVTQQRSRRDAEETKAHSARQSGGPAGIIILNVDDNEAMRFARSAVLRQEGYQVIEAATGSEALRLLEWNEAHIVLLDVNLPDINGLDVCRLIKSDERWRKVWVVQTSATFSSPLDQLQGLEAGGADMYLAEPVPRAALLSLMHRLAAKSN